MYNHIATVSGASSFELAEGFPPKPVNLALTVEQADIQGGSLIQKGWLTKIKKMIDWYICLLKIIFFS